MMRKGAIHLVLSQKGEFLSNLLLASKKDGVERLTCGKSKKFERVSSISTLQNRENSLKDLLQQRNLMSKIDLKSAYLCVPFQKESRKYIRFEWERNLYEFLCLSFRLGPAPRIFTKLLKTAIPRRLKFRIIVYLDVMLLMRPASEDISMARDTLIFLLQHLGL